MASFDTLRYNNGLFSRKPHGGLFAPPVGSFYYIKGCFLTVVSYVDLLNSKACPFSVGSFRLPGPRTVPRHYTETECDLAFRR